MTNPPKDPWRRISALLLLGSLAAATAWRAPEPLGEAAAAIRAGRREYRDLRLGPVHRAARALRKEREPSPLPLVAVGPADAHAAAFATAGLYPRPTVLFTDPAAYVAAARAGRIPPRALLFHASSRPGPVMADLSQVVAEAGDDATLAPATRILPFAVAAEGEPPDRYATALRLRNPGTRPAVARLVWHPVTGVGTEAMLRVAAGAELVREDVVRTELRGSGVGWLELDAPAGVEVSAELVNAGRPGSRPTPIPVAAPFTGERFVRWGGRVAESPKLWILAPSARVVVEIRGGTGTDRSVREVAVPAGRLMRVDPPGPAGVGEREASVRASRPAVVFVSTKDPATGASELSFAVPR